MKLDAVTKVWLWSATAAGVGVSLSAYYRAVGSMGEGGLAIAFLAIVAVLFVLALKLATARRRLNLTVAAETIVALGIFSLVISMTAAIYGILTLYSREILTKDFSFEDMQRFALPFLEGLTTAAIAPLVATFLRNCEASFSVLETGEAGMRESVLAADELAKQLRHTSASFAKLNKELDHNAEGFQTATTSAATAAARLGGVFDSEADRLRHALLRVQAEATGLSDVTEKSRSAVSSFTSSMSGLSGSAKDARDLLDALGKLIESVERFVRPEASRR